MLGAVIRKFFTQQQPVARATPIQPTEQIDCGFCTHEPTAPEQVDETSSSATRTFGQETPNQYCDVPLLREIKIDFLKEFQKLDLSQEVANTLRKYADEFHHIMSNSSSRKDFETKIALLQNDMYTAFYCLYQETQLLSSNFSTTEFTLGEAPDFLKIQVKNVLTMFFVMDIHVDNLHSKSHKGYLNRKTNTFDNMMQVLVQNKKNTAGFSSFFDTEFYILPAVKSLNIIIAKNNEYCSVYDFETLLGSPELILNEQKGQGVNLYGVKKNFIFIQNEAFIHLGSCDASANCVGYGVRKYNKKIIAGIFRSGNRFNGNVPLLPTYAKIKFSNGLIYDGRIDESGLLLDLTEMVNDGDYLVKAPKEFEFELLNGKTYKGPVDKYGQIISTMK